MLQIYLHRRQSRLILQSSIHHAAPNSILAALVLEVDTIPKPDGLGTIKDIAYIEQN